MVTSYLPASASASNLDANILNGYWPMFEKQQHQQYKHGGHTNSVAV
jgi:hypothetical protein